MLQLQFGGQKGFTTLGADSEPPLYRGRCWKTVIARHAIAAEKNFENVVENQDGSQAGSGGQTKDELHCGHSIPGKVLVPFGQKSQLQDLSLCKSNERESTINRSLDGSIFPG